MYISIDPNKQGQTPSHEAGALIDLAKTATSVEQVLEQKPIAEKMPYSQELGRPVSGAHMEINNMFANNKAALDNPTLGTAKKRDIVADNIARTAKNVTARMQEFAIALAGLDEINPSLRDSVNKLFGRTQESMSKTHGLRNNLSQQAAQEKPKEQEASKETDQQQQATQDKQVEAAVQGAAQLQEADAQNSKDTSTAAAKQAKAKRPIKPLPDLTKTGKKGKTRQKEQQVGK